MARVTTKGGDEGYTDLLGSVRVPKYHRRPEAYGTVDEASSSLGLARAYLRGSPLDDPLRTLQTDLYTMMAELATPPENYSRVDFKIRPDDVSRLESMADEYKSRVEIGKKFVVPGDTIAGAALDVARTVVRRAERQVARMYHEGDVTNAEVVHYLNRLSDLLFIVARYADAHFSAPSPSEGSTSDADGPGEK